MLRICMAGFLSVFFLIPDAHTQILNPRQWGSGEIINITKDVLDTKNEVLTGRLAIVKNDLHQQLVELNQRGGPVKDSIQDFLQWLEDRREPYESFVFSMRNGERCGAGSRCSEFRAELTQFVQDLTDAEMREMFPIIDRIGLDGGRAIDTINIAPAVVLFAIHETLGRTEEWKKIPVNLRDLFDEIGDRQVFSSFLDPFSEEPSTNAVIANNMLFERTPTQRFCDRHASRLERQIDPVRLNRLKLYVDFVKAFPDSMNSILSPTVGLSLVGEGSDSLLPNPVSGMFKVMVTVIETTQRAVQTFRDNLQICRDRRRELELQLAQCIELVDFVKPTKRDEVYELVVDIVNKAEEELVPVSNARKSLARAEAHRDNARWKEAYVSLCDAYQKIGT